MDRMLKFKPTWLYVVPINENELIPIDTCVFVIETGGVHKLVQYSSRVVASLSKRKILFSTYLAHIAPASVTQE